MCHQMVRNVYTFFLALSLLAKTYEARHQGNNWWVLIFCISGQSSTLDEFSSNEDSSSEMGVWKEWGLRSYSTWSNKIHILTHFLSGLNSHKQYFATILAFRDVDLAWVSKSIICQILLSYSYLGILKFLHFFPRYRLTVSNLHWKISLQNVVEITIKSFVCDNFTSRGSTYVRRRYKLINLQLSFLLILRIL